MGMNKDYALVGGQAVPIKPLTITASGTYTAPEGGAFNPVTCNIGPAMEEVAETISTNGETVITPSEGKEGISKATITVAVPPFLTGMDAPYEAKNGMYILTAVDADSATEAAVCTIAEGAITASWGDGTLAIDSTGDTPVLEWTPTITATETKCYYGEGVE